MIRKLLPAACGVLLLAAFAGGPAYASAAVASVRSPDSAVSFAEGYVCAQNGTGYCLNDWNGAGSGGAVKMYNFGYSNDAWTLYQMTGYCSGGYVSSSLACPFPNGSGLNSTYNGDYIMEVKSQVSGACIGTDGAGFANLGPCPPDSGGKGSNLWVFEGGGPIVSVYWSKQHGNNSEADLVSGGSIGAQAYESEYGSSSWGVDLP